MTFDTAYGTPATDRRDARVEGIVARDMAKLSRIATALHFALTMVRNTGPTEYAYIAGEYYADVLARLEALIPDTSPAAETVLRERVLDAVNAEAMLPQEACDDE